MLYEEGIHNLGTIPKLRKAKIEIFDPTPIMEFVGVSRQNRIIS